MSYNSGVRRGERGEIPPPRNEKKKRKKGEKEGGKGKKKEKREERRKEERKRRKFHRIFQFFRVNNFKFRVPLGLSPPPNQNPAYPYVAQ